MSLYTPANPFDYLMSGGFRSYNGVPSKQDVFTYAFNPYYDNGAGKTGQMQLLTTNNQGALRVDIGTGLNISATITGVTVNIPPSTAVTGIVNVTGVVTSATWGKVKSTGYVSTFTAVGSACIVNKVQGFTKTNVNPSYIQLYDSATVPTAGATPDFVVAVQTNNNYFIDLAEAGVVFANGLQIVSSSTPDVYTAVGAADFICSAVLK